MRELLSKVFFVKYKLQNNKHTHGGAERRVQRQTHTVVHSGFTTHSTGTNAGDTGDRVRVGVLDDDDDGEGEDTGDIVNVVAAEAKRAAAVRVNEDEGDAGDSLSDAEGDSRSGEGTMLLGEAAEYVKKSTEESDHKFYTILSVVSCLLARVCFSSKPIFMMTHTRDSRSEIDEKNVQTRIG